MRLEKNICQLLFQYDCVIVPNFGAFITYPSPSIINKEENIINPPFKKVNFSTNITTDDGILKKSYAKNEKVDLETAGLLLDRDITQWNSILSKQQPIFLEKIGILRKNENHELEFEAHTSINFLAFGSKPIQPNFVLPQTNQKIVKSKRKWTSVLAIASIIPIIVGGYFYFNTPQPIQNFVDHQWSGIVLPVIKDAAPTTETKENSSIHNLPTTIADPMQFVAQEKEQVEPTDSIEDKVISKYEVTVLEEKQLSKDEKEVKAIIKNTKVESKEIKDSSPAKKEEVKTIASKETKDIKKDETIKIDVNPKKYQIIAASLRRPEDATRMLNSLEKDGYKKSSIVYSKGYHYFVTYESFNDKAQATKYLNELHKKHPDAWIREHK